MPWSPRSRARGTEPPLKPVLCSGFTVFHATPEVPDVFFAEEKSATWGFDLVLGGCPKTACAA